MGKKTEPKPDWHETLHGHKPEDVNEALEMAFRYAQTVSGATERCRKKLCRSEGRCHLVIEPDTGDGICPAGLRASELESGVLMLGFLAEVWRVKVGRAPPRPGEFERLMARRERERENMTHEEALLARDDEIDRLNGWGKYNTEPEPDPETSRLALADEIDQLNGWGKYSSATDAPAGADEALSGEIGKGAD